MINAILIPLLASFVVGTVTEKIGKFSLPISKIERVLSEIIPPIPDQYGGIQKHLKSDSESILSAHINEESSRSHGYPVKNQAFLFNTVNLSIGTPPQPFRAVVDLTWSDLFVPSSTCFSPSPRYCNPSNATYNASASSTYHENGTITRIGYASNHGYAHLSEDVLTFSNGLQVPEQVFHEVKYYENPRDEWGVGLFDGVLGLAIDMPWIPGPFRALNILSSPFRNMVDHGTLDKNMFSIVWPSEVREQGDLMFGGYDEELLDGELVAHPLVPENTTNWQIGIEKVFMTSRDGESLVNKTIPEGKAFFMSSVPFIAFSYSLAKSLIKHIPSWPSACVRFLMVDCDDIPLLPEIIIGFRGQNVTLRGEDYVRRLKAPECPLIEGECHLMMDYLGGMEDLVVLGAPFLEKVMGVFNWDERTISFGELKKQ